jgi:phosphoribosylaminoimidazole carboxylase (NCAIR synthetase)
LEEAKSLNRNNMNFDQNGQNLQGEVKAAELAVIGEVLSTLGDAVSTIAAVLALEELRKEQHDKDDYKNMKKQIDYLTTEFEKLKKSRK